MTMRLPWQNALISQTNYLLKQQPGQVFHAMNRDVEATLIRCALTAAGGCRQDAARLLGIGRNTITRKIQEFDLDDRRFQQDAL